MGNYDKHPLIYLSPFWFANHFHRNQDLFILNQLYIAGFNAGFNEYAKLHKQFSRTFWIKQDAISLWETKSIKIYVRTNIFTNALLYSWICP